MQYQDRIREIVSRARRINVTLHSVCREAAVPYSTLWRWQEGRVSPKVGSVEHHLDRLEAEMSRRERDLASALLRRAS